MILSKKLIPMAFVAICIVMALTAGPGFAADKKPNIMFIMGDDIGWMQPSIYHRGLMVGETPNIDRIGNEQAVTINSKTAAGLGGSLAAPSTAYLYDWNILPIGQLLWLKHLESYKIYPLLQAPETYNLDEIIAEVKRATNISHAGE